MFIMKKIIESKFDVGDHVYVPIVSEDDFSDYSIHARRVQEIKISFNANGFDYADYVISSLPLTVFPKELKNNILDDHLHPKYNMKIHHLHKNYILQQ